MATKHNPQRVRGVTSKVEEHLPELRGNLTPQERVLWDALRGRRLEDVKFRRQHPLGAFVLDFYAPELRLVVELDGDVHDDPSARPATEAGTRISPRMATMSSASPIWRLSWIYPTS